jgi:hypothetical protein
VELLTDSLRTILDLLSRSPEQMGYDRAFEKDKEEVLDYLESNGIEYTPII